MSGLTYIATYEHDDGERTYESFVAESSEKALQRAATDCPPTASLKEVKISDAQRLLDPELDHTKMRHDDSVMDVRWEDVVTVGKEKGIATDLAPDEMRVFLKCVESGLSCWIEVVELALMAATSERSGS